MKKLIILMLAVLMVANIYGQQDNVTANWKKDNTIELIMANWYENLASYAELHSMDDVIATSTDSAYVKLTDWTIGTYKNATPDTTGNIIFTTAGVYRIAFSISFTHSVNLAICHVTAFKNSTELTAIECERKVRTGTDVGSMSASGLVTFAVGDTLQLRGKSGKDGNLTFYHSNFTIVRLR